MAFDNPRETSGEADPVPGPPGLLGGGYRAAFHDPNPLLGTPPNHDSAAEVARLLLANPQYQEHEVKDNLNRLRAEAAEVEHRRTEIRAATLGVDQAGVEQAEHGRRREVEGWERAQGLAPADAERLMELTIRTEQVEGEFYTAHEQHGNDRAHLSEPVVRALQQAFQQEGERRWQAEREDRWAAAQPGTPQYVMRAASLPEVTPEQARAAAGRSDADALAQHQPKAGPPSRGPEQAW